MALDPKNKLDVDTIKKLGQKAVVELMDVVDKRADQNGVTFPSACASLPEVWRATMLLGYVVSKFEQGDNHREVLWDLETDAARGLIIDALKEIGEKQLSSTFAEVAEETDFDAEDLDEAGATPDPPGPDDLARIRKKLVALVRSMDTPFPAAP
jgi:hypothetical protein